MRQGEPLEDMLDHLARVDDHLEGRMPGSERKLVRRDARRLIEDLAFRFAFLDGRLAPADIDYARALEALKPPPRAAEGILSRRAGYTRRARRALVSRLATLAVVASLLGGLALLALSETSVPLATYVGGGPEARSASDPQTVVVPAGLDRVYLVVHPIVRGEGAVTVTVFGPSSEVLYQRIFTRGDTYADANLPATPGEWLLVVDYHDAVANARIELTGVRAR